MDSLAGWKKDPLLRGTAVLSLGTAASQLLPMAALPLLGRTCTQEDFGRFGLFTAAVSVLSPFACLKYDQAIPAAGKEGEAAALFWLSMGLSLALGTGTALIPSMGPAGFQTVLTGWYGALSGLRLRQGKYGRLAFSLAAKSLAGVLVPVLVPGGLAGGQMAGTALGCVLLALGRLPGTGVALWHTAYRYRAFPRCTLPGALAASAVYSLTSFWMAFFYPEQVLGQYTAAARIAFAPAALAVPALGQVFLREGARAGPGPEFAGIFRRAVRALILLAVPAFGLLFLLAEPLTLLLLGEQWTPAAVLLRRLIPAAAARLAAAPAASVPLALGRNDLTMKGQLVLLLFSALPAGAAFLAKRQGSPLSPESYVGLLSAGLTAGYLLLGWTAAELVCRAGKEGPHPEA